MKSVKFLEKLQFEKRMNDSEVAAFLKISKSAVSQYKSGNRVMGEETCLAIAFALEIDPISILAAAGIDRAELSGQKSLWEVFMTRMAATASALLCALFVSFFVTPQNAEASPMKAYSNVSEKQSLYYVKLNAEMGTQKTRKYNLQNKHNPCFFCIASDNALSNPKSPFLQSDR